MQPHDFIAKWQNTTLKERSAAQEHFIDLCRLLGEKTPAEADPEGRDYAFEFGATKSGGGHGFADVFKRGHFGIEYKGTHANLDAALDQLRRYEIALDRPPLLIVTDIGTTIRVHTNWTNSVSKVHQIAIADLVDAEKRAILKNAFVDPEALKPTKTRQQLTEEVAAEFAALTASLRARGHDAERVAHFVNRLVFCMFAEDVDLLPGNMFTKMLQRASDEPHEFASFAADLFTAMQKGGRVGFDKIPWFNGGLFDDDLVFPLSKGEIANVLNAAKQDWSDIDPAILGTLFERGLDPDKRSQLGAHYTDRTKIEMIVRPVIADPLSAEWATAKAEITALMEKAEETKGGTRTKARNQAQAILDTYLARLRNFRVLDPACGSGNFLYVALKTLKDLEHRARVEAEALGLPRGLPEVGPEAVHGIEINPYAAELARVSVWIGEIQWMLKNGFGASRDPILRPLDTIQCCDALLKPDGSETAWPDTTVIIGNPPFLGAKLMNRILGKSETERIRKAFEGRLGGFTDLVCYWFEKAREKIADGTCERAGLVATNSIRKNTNLPVMHRILADTRIFEAWSEEKWTIDGAAVDVSLVCFGDPERPAKLDGQEVAMVNADLTTGIDLTKAKELLENRGSAFLGIQKSGPFDVNGRIARVWMTEPSNPNGVPNREILRPYWNGDDVTGRPRDFWLIDLPVGLSQASAALFVSPFSHLVTATDENGKTVKELRADLGDRAGPRWWEPHWPRPEMRRRIAALARFIVTPETAQHRIFVWLSPPTLPDKNLIVIPRDDDTTFGLLQSTLHRLWALRKGSDLQDRPRYTHTSVFATFPFPEGLSPNIPAADYADDARAIAIAEAARRLNELRENWLNPADLVRREAEVVPGFPDRLLPIDDQAELELRRRTLTNLYNERPHWLVLAHEALDVAVAAAYGWPKDISDEEAIARLFALNQERAKNQ